MRWPAGQGMAGSLEQRGRLQEREGSSSLAALFLPHVPCVWVRRRGGALQKEQGANRKVPDAEQAGLPWLLGETWPFPYHCLGCRVEKGHGFCCRYLQNDCAPVNALSPSLQGEPGPMAPKGECPLSSLWDLLLLWECWSLGSPVLAARRGGKGRSKACLLPGVLTGL